jgi:hypothetical protein
MSFLSAFNALFGFGALMICTVPSALLAVFAVPCVLFQQW